MKEYCVIGEHAGNSATSKRKWHSDLDEAVVSATNLLRHNVSQVRGPDKLYVVKIVAVVELSTPPINVREPDDTDNG